jgi:hypothetical protein
MRLNKILRNAFILDLDFEKSNDYIISGIDTRQKLDKSLEKFFNIFGKDPDNLIRLMDAAVNSEIKERMLLTLSGTSLTDEDEENFIPVVREEDEIKLDDK